MRGRTAVRVHERLKARGTEAAEPGPDSLPHAVHRREQVHVERRVREEMRIGLAAEDPQAARYRELLVRAILAGQAETDAGKTEPGRDGEKNEERGPARPRRGGLSSAPRCVQGRDTPALRVLVFVNKSVTTTAPSMIWFPIRTFEAPPASVAAERALPITTPPVRPSLTQKVRSALASHPSSVFYSASQHDSGVVSPHRSRRQRPRRLHLLGRSLPRCSGGPASQGEHRELPEGMPAQVVMVRTHGLNLIPAIAERGFHDGIGQVHVLEWPPVVMIASFTLRRFQCELSSPT